MEAPQKIRVGTCAWTDKSLIEAGWYPRGTNTAEGRLRHYAARFPLVEVDSSYYAMPSAANARLWVERTPANFVFDIKAFRIFTGHQTPPQALPRDLLAALPESTLRGKRNVYYKDLPDELSDELWQRYRRAVEPLRSAQKLGVVLFQFPPWFVPEPSSLQHIEQCCARMEGHELAIEFRHHAWLAEPQREHTFAFLRERGLSFVAVDEPQGFRSSVPPLLEVTGPYVIVRFHGRNAPAWEAPGDSASDRFNYLYRREELAGWAEQITEVSRLPVLVHALMNTNFGSQGPENAELLAELMGAGLWPDEAGAHAGEAGTLPF